MNKKNKFSLLNYPIYLKINVLNYTNIFKLKNNILFMDSIEDGATIRIGFRKYYKILDNVSNDFEVPTYSLKINKKSILIFCGGSERNYLEVYENAAKEIAKLMNKRGVKKYVVYNGERVRTTNKKWESCGYVPRDGEEIFKKTLEASLN
jgi:hypothetical protein